MNILSTFFKKEWTVAPIKVEVDSASTPLTETICFIINKLKGGRTSTKNEACQGHPFEANTPQTVENIHCIEMQNRRLKLCDTAQIVGTSVNTVYNLPQEKNKIEKYELFIVGIEIVDHKPKAHA